MTVADVAVDFTEEATVKTITGTALTKIHESSASLELGRRYLLLVRGSLTSDSLTNGEGVVFQVYDESNGSYFTDSNWVHNPQSVAQYHHYSYATVFNAGKNDGKIELRLAGEAAGIEGKCVYCSIALIDVSGLTEGIDYFVDSDATTATHTTSYVDRASKTITLPSSTQADGDWLVMAHARIDITAANKFAIVRIHSDTLISQTPESYQESEHTTEYNSNVLSRVYALSYAESATYTFKVQTCDYRTNSPQHEYESSTIIGLRLDAFAASSSDYTNAAVETTSVGFTTGESITVSESAGTTRDYFVIGSYLVVPEGGSRQFAARLRNDNGSAADSSIMNAAQESYSTTNSHDRNDKQPVFMFGTTSVDGDNGTNTITCEFKKDSTDLYGVKDVCLVAFRVGDNAREKVRRVWDGSHSSVLSDGTNWTPSGIPTTADDLVFNTGTESVDSGELAVQGVYIGGSYSGSMTSVTFQAKKVVQSTKKPIVKFVVKGGVGWRNGLANPMQVYLWDTPVKDDDCRVTCNDSTTNAFAYIRNSRGRVSVTGDEWDKIVSYSSRFSKVLYSGDGADVVLIGSGNFNATGSPADVTVAGEQRFTQTGNRATVVNLWNSGKVNWLGVTSGSSWYIYSGTFDMRNITTKYQAATVKLFNGKLDARTSIDGFISPSLSFRTFGSKGKILWDSGSVVGVS